MPDEQTNQPAATSQPSPAAAATAQPTPASAAPAAASTTTPSQPGSEAPKTESGSAKVERPAYIPETFWDSASGQVKDKEFGEHLNELSAFKAADDVKRLSRPQKPDEYQVALPQDFKAPEGIDFKFNDGDPLLAQARTAAHEMGLTQDQFSKMLGIYAGSRIGETQAFANAKTAEIAKLGPAGSTRVTAVTTFLNSALGPEAAPLIDSIWTASAIQSWEKLITRLSGQGAGSFSSAHREPPEAAGKIPGFATMTFEQKRDAQLRINGTAAGR